MNIDIYGVANILTGVFGAIMMMTLLDTCFAKRQNLPKRAYLLGTLGLAVLMNLSNYFLGDGLLNALGMTGSIFAASWLYKGKRRVKAMVSVFGFLLIVIIELLVLFAVTMAYNITVADVVKNQSIRLLGIVVSKMLTFMTICFFRVKFKKRDYSMNASNCALFILIFTISILSVFLIYKLSFDIKVRYMYNLSVLCSFGLLFNTFFMLYLYEHMREQNEIIQRQKHFEQQMKEQSKHLDEILISQNQLKKFRHDLSNHLIALSKFFSSKDFEGGEEYIKSIGSGLTSGSGMFNSGNITLDAIISSKKALAADKNISFVTRVQIPENISIDPVDLCILFGNALDNAIEACEKAESVKKEIMLTMLYDNGSIFCKISNPAPPVKEKGFKTTKKDKANHGFGLESIRTVLEKYGTEPEILRTDAEFVLRFVIFADKR